MDTPQHRDINNKKERDNSEDEVFSIPVKAGKRIYYFDVKSTRTDEFYVTITESRKRLNHDGSFAVDKHKIHIYKEDFVKFSNGLKEVLRFIHSRQPNIYRRPDETAGESRYDKHSAVSAEYDLFQKIPIEEEFLNDMYLP